MMEKKQSAYDVWKILTLNGHTDEEKVEILQYTIEVYGPPKAIIIDNNLLSIASYLEEHPEYFRKEEQNGQVE